MHVYVGLFFVLFENVCITTFYNGMYVGVYLGRPYSYKVNEDIRVSYNTGSAGYILDRVAVQRLGGNLDLPACHPHHQVKIMRSYNNP